MVSTYKDKGGEEHFDQSTTPTKYREQWVQYMSLHDAFEGKQLTGAASQRNVLQLEQSETQQRVTFDAVKQDQLSLMPQFEGPVVVFDRQKLINEDNFPHLGNKVLVVNDVYSLGRELGFRDRGVLIELNSERRDQLALDRVYRSPSHFPRYVRVSTIEGLAAAVSNTSSWFRSSILCSGEPLDQNLFYQWQCENVQHDIPITLSKITGKVSEKTAVETIELLHSVAQCISDRKVDLSDTKDYEAGFFSSYSFEQLAGLLEFPGAELYVVHKDGVVLGYSLFFLDQNSFPQRGNALAKALRSTGQAATKLGYGKILEVTPAGEDVARIFDLDLYDTLIRQAFKSAQLMGIQSIVFESRAYPVPNKESFVGHMRKGARYSGVILEHDLVDGKKTIPYRAAVLSFDVDQVLDMQEFGIDVVAREKRRALRRGRSAEYNVRPDYCYRMSIADRYKLVTELLAGEEQRQFCTGSNYRSEEHILIKHSSETGALTVRHWIWDNIVECMIHSIELRAVPSNVVEDKIDKLLALVKDFGEEQAEEDFNDLPPHEYFAKEFARLGVCCVLRVE